MENGILVAMYLKAHQKIEKIIYPNLEECSVDIESYQVMQKQASGFTGMISFYLKSENFDSICDFAKNLRLFKFGTSLGGVDSLLDHFGGTMRIYYTKE